MRILIQRVKNARVRVSGQIISRIDKGLLVFVGISKDDNLADIERLSAKLINLRIFEDEKGKMNLNIKQVNAKVLSIPQFTLYANTKKGNRPAFEQSALPDKAKDYWQRFNDLLIKNGIFVERGIFGVHMQVELINDGPVTIWLDSAR